MNEGHFPTRMLDQPPDQVPSIGVGMLGYGLMGHAHTNALKKLAYMIDPPAADPQLVAIAGRSRVEVEKAARRFGYRRFYTRWEDLVGDPEVQLLDNGTPPDVHAKPSIAAARAGKAVFCEKPLARSAEEAYRMLEAVRQAGVKHMTGFNYRFVPAIMLARRMIQAGELGHIYHFRARYLQDWLLPHMEAPLSWRLMEDRSGTGVLGSLGSHLIDLARFLVGEIVTVTGMTRTFISTRTTSTGQPGTVDVDDAFASALAFENGAIGTLEASRYSAGYKNGNQFEVSGELGTLRFNLERLNELEVFRVDDPQPQGFTTVLVTEDHHPYMRHWWPPGHLIGWEHTFVHEFAHLFDCLVNDRSVEPLGATFEDGYRAAVVCDAVLESVQTKRQVDIQFA